MNIAARRKLVYKEKNHLEFKDIIIADDIDNKLAHFYASNSHTETLIFDFTQARFIDISALINLIAVLRQRTEMKLVTYIGYPKFKKVRDFLKVWGFPEAVEEATGLQLTQLVLPGHEHYLNEKQTTYTGIGDGLDALEYNPDLNSHNNFFGFTSFRTENTMSITPEGSLTQIPRIESRRWTNTLIREVLKKHLSNGIPQDEFARVIVYESMSNAVRHPYAHIIEVVSVFTRKKMFAEIDDNEKLSAKSLDRTKTLVGNFRACIWDDGFGIAETLLKPLKEGGGIRHSKPPIYMCDKTYVSLRSFNEEEEDHFIYNEYDTPNISSKEYELLLASFSPGITRTAYKAVANVEPFGTTPIDDLGRDYEILPGMGLYALKRTVIDEFQGKIIVRSGNYRFILTSAWKKSYKYSCKITRYPENFPSFRGNLLEIHLPIRETSI